MRKLIIKTRGELSALEVQEKSKSITGRLLALPEFRQARMVMAYMDFRNEVMTGEIIKKSFELGKRVALPAVMKDGEGPRGVLAAFEVPGPGEGLRRGVFGILEPDPGKTKPVDISGIDIVIVPGVAFGMDKSRLGYGAGYYDNFLCRIRGDCLKVGVAFELQLLESLPVEPHDLALDMILTESREIR